jgi:hypothetical protein
MQLSKSDLVHSVSLLLKDYPDGLIFKAAPKVIFYSEEKISEQGAQLMEAALSKGLQLNNEQFLLFLDKNKLQSFLDNKTDSNEFLIVLFGESTLDVNWSLKTASADVIAVDTQVKKIFWNSLKDAYLNFLNKE